MSNIILTMVNFRPYLVLHMEVAFSSFEYYYAPNLISLTSKAARGLRPKSNIWGISNCSCPAPSHINQNQLTISRLFEACKRLQFQLIQYLIENELVRYFWLQIVSKLYVEFWRARTKSTESLKNSSIQLLSRYEILKSWLI